MLIIISTEAVKKEFSAALSTAFSFDQWLVMENHNIDEKKIVSLINKSKQACGNIIMLSEYDSESEAYDLKMNLEGWLITHFCYRTNADISNWVRAIDQYNKDMPNQALVMGMMKPFYIQWAKKIFTYLTDSKYGKNVSIHLPETTTAVELAEKLSEGCRLATYTGHGRSRGWSGYRGFRWEHVEMFKQISPIGSLISLSCSSLKQERVDTIPLALKWVMDGRVCTYIGSTQSVQIKPLAKITSILLECIAKPEVKRVDQLILSVNKEIKQLNEPDVSFNWSTFRLIGNPLQPL